MSVERDGGEESRLVGDGSDEGEDVAGVTHDACGADTEDGEVSSW